jgi:hypothetical protein
MSAEPDPRRPRQSLAWQADRDRHGRLHHLRPRQDAKTTP